MKPLRLGPSDNVVIAAMALPAGTALGVDDIRCLTAIERGHKIAVARIARGGKVVKLGQTIGIATNDIAAGDWVHDHNIRNPSAAEIHAPASSPSTPPTSPVAAAPESPLTFKGYRRADGRAATRNYIGILTTVNCSATVARGIADAFRAPGAFDRYPNVDGVVAFTHATGCGMQAGSTGHAVLQRTIEGYLDHPNFAAVLLIGLGCEVNRGVMLRRPGGGADHAYYFDIQDVGGTRKAIDQGIDRIREYLAFADAARREDIPVSELKVGLQCGGSDAFSALTANPALGVAADLLVSHGGTVILSETPEVAAWAEQLCARAVSADVAQKMRDKVKWWEDHAAAAGATLDGNPSPGNRAGGLSTIAEKALGAIAKGGQSALAAVCDYAEPIAARGLVFMDSPGFDPVSATGQIASGANLICFTTGRGSVFGAKPAPSLKLATNSDVFRRMSEDMDIDCGGIIDGRTDLQTLGREIFARIVETASGAATCSEKLNIGENEFAPWQLGAVL